MVLTRAGPNRWWAAAAELAFIAGAPADAFGGAWTMPQGTGQLIETLYGWTGFGPPCGGNFAIDGVPGFLDAEVAYRLRTEGPPDEWHGDVTVGFKFTPKIMLMLQDFTTVSMSTNNRTFPA